VCLIKNEMIDANRMTKSKLLNIQGNNISIISQKEEDYISLTDMARSQMQEVVIIKWQ
jgi:hypothetical protein